MSDRIPEFGEDHSDEHNEETQEGDDHGALTGDSGEADVESDDTIELDTESGRFSDQSDDADIPSAEPIEVVAEEVDDNEGGDDDRFEDVEVVEVVEEVERDEETDDASPNVTVESDSVELEDAESYDEDTDTTDDDAVVASPYQRTTQEQPVVSRVETQPLTKLNRFLGSIWLLIPVILAGLAARSHWFWKQPALWLDEADLTREVLGRSFRDLLEPLDEQSAPVGFLLLVKSAVELFNDSEIGLRLIPLIGAGFAVVFLAWAARKLLEPTDALLAVALFCVSWPVIGYAAEMKQYSMDAMTSALMIGLGAWMLLGTPTRLKFVVFALVGIVVQWLSLPVLFTLSGVGLVVGLVALRQQDWKQVGVLLAIALAWIGSFAVNYFTTLRHYAGSEHFQNWHYDAFLRVPPEESWATTAKWLVWTFTDMFADPVGLVLPGLGVFGFVAGVIILGRKRFSVLAMLVLPMVVMLVASYLQRYPVFGRFLQFLVPSVVLITAVGLGATTRHLWKAHRPLAVVLILLVFAQPLAVTVNALAKPADQGIRPLVAHLEEAIASEDKVYIHYWIRNEFDYYTRQMTSMDDAAIQVGITARREWSYYEAEIRGFGGQSKVWFALQDNDLHMLQGERQFFETRLDALGTRLSYDVWGDYHLYAYDLSALEVPEVSAVEEPAVAVIETPAEGDAATDPEPASDSEPELGDSVVESTEN